MDVRPAPQPHQAPPDGRTRFHLFRSDHVLRRLDAVRSAWQALRAWMQATSAAPEWVPAGFRRPLAGYLLALLLAVGAASLILLLVSLVPTLDLEGVPLLVGIVLVALTCGVGPSLLATGVGLVLLAGVALLASHPVQQSSADWVDLVVLLVSGLGLSLLAGTLRAAKASSDLERQRLRALLEVLPVPVTMVDCEGRFVENTPAGKVLWGDPASWARSLAEVPAYPAWRPDTSQPVAREEMPLVRALTKGQSTLNEELAFEAVDGQHHILLNSAIPMWDASGAMVGAVSVVQDMTERKRLEEALRQAEREAAARAGELEAIFEALTDGLVVYDTQGRILRDNIAARQLVGMEVHPEFASLPWQERASRYAPLDTQGRPVPPEDFALARLLRGEILTGAHTAEDCLQTLDGREVAVSMTGRPLRDAEGEIIGAVSIARDVTERRRLERQVTEHAAQLEAIFESVADGLVVIDAQGRVLQMNQAYRTMLAIEHDPTGWTFPHLAELAGFASSTPAGHLLTEEEDPFAAVLLGKVLTREQSVDVLLRTRGGHETWTNSTAAPIRDQTGQIIGAVGVIRDVTERRRMEREIAERAAQLEAIFESIADGVFVTDRQERILYMNQAFRTFLGLEQAPTGWTFPQLASIAGVAGYTAEGLPMRDLPVPPHRRTLQGEVLTNEQSFDHIIRTRAGHETRVNVTGAPIRDARGQIIGSVGVVRDVTGQRRLEQQTRASLEALLAMAEAMVQTPGETSAARSAEVPRASSGADPALPVVARRLAELTCRVLGFQVVSMVAVDPTTERLTPITVVGLPPEQEQQWWASWDRPSRLDERLSPRLAAWLRAGEPGLMERTEHPHQRLPLFTEMPSLMIPMRMGDTLVGVLRVEEQRQHPVGTRYQETAVTQAVARLGALVLERERLLCQRTEAQASELALRETQVQMETFLGMAGHELKNPLTSLKLALQLIERRIRRLARDESDQSHPLASSLDQVARAGHQTERLERLVNELLDASRVRAGKLELHPEPADLAAIVGEAMEEQRQAHPERTLTFQFAPSRPVPIFADADRIGQVVTNYLTNALKYSPVDCPVAVGLDVDEGQARVWVRDQGPGIPQAEQERIWERFHRAKGIEVQSGTGVGLGLGLHICRTIIERHQGQVGVQSVPGQGSTFWFTVPLGGEPEEEGPAPG